MGLSIEQKKEKVGKFFRYAREISQIEPEDVVLFCIGIDSVKTLNRLDSGEVVDPDNVVRLANFYGLNIELTNKILEYLRANQRIKEYSGSAITYISQRILDIRAQIKRTRVEPGKLIDIVNKYFPERTLINEYLLSNCGDIKSLVEGIETLDDYLTKSAIRIGDNGRLYLNSIENAEPIEIILANHSHSVYFIIKNYSDENRANILITIVDACGNTGEGLYNPKDTKNWIADTENLGFRKNRILIPLAHLSEYLRSGSKLKRIFMIGTEYVSPDGSFLTTLGLRPVFEVVTSNRIPVLLAAQSFKVISGREFETFKSSKMKRIHGEYPLECFKLSTRDIIVTDHDYHTFKDGWSLKCCSDYWKKQMNIN